MPAHGDLGHGGLSDWSGAVTASQVFCNGEEVLTTSGTQKSYTVDVWSGNHPFFQGAANTVLMDEGSVNRFKRRYGGLDSMSDMSRIKTGMRMLCRSSRV